MGEGPEIIMRNRPSTRLQGQTPSADDELLYHSLLPTLWQEYTDDLLAGRSLLLSPAQLVFPRVHYCNSEVCNGGLWHFVHNGIEDSWDDTVESFDAIGANEHAALLRQVGLLFPAPLCASASQRKRMILGLVPDPPPGGSKHELKVRLASNDRHYAALNEKEPIDTMLVAYIRKHWDSIAGGN